MVLVTVSDLFGSDLLRALADMNKDGKMDRLEFSIAMKLIKLKLQGQNLPTSLPIIMKQPPVPAPSLTPSLMGNTNTDTNTVQWHSTPCVWRYEVHLAMQFSVLCGAGGWTDGVLYRTVGFPLSLMRATGSCFTPQRRQEGRETRAEYQGERICNQTLIKHLSV